MPSGIQHQGEAMTMTKEERAALQRQIARAKQLVHLSCRVGGTRHRWVQCIPDWEPAYTNAVGVAHQCDTCQTIKRANITKQGEMLGKPEYDYPPEYQYRPTEEEGPLTELAVSSQAVRAAMLARTEMAKLPALVPIVRR